MTSALVYCLCFSEAAGITSGSIDIKIGYTGRQRHLCFAGLYAEGHPIFSKADFNSRRPDLKRLEFMRTYSQYYVTKVANLYKNSRACLPPACLSGLSTIESRVTNLSAPLVAGLQDNSERMLWNLDCRVELPLIFAYSISHLAEVSTLQLPADCSKAVYLCLVLRLALAFYTLSLPI